MAYVLLSVTLFSRSVIAGACDASSRQHHGGELSTFTPPGSFTTPRIPSETSPLLSSPLRPYMRHFKPTTTTSEPESPLNTTLEDSINMPQNHKRNRHSPAASQPPLTSAPAPRTPMNTPPRPQRPTNPFGSPVPMCDDASGAIHDVPSSPRQPLAYTFGSRNSSDFGESIAPIPRGLIESSGYNPHPSPRRSEGSKRPPPLNRDWRPLQDQPIGGLASVVPQVLAALREKNANKKLDTAMPTFATTKIPYSKIHERSAQVPASPKNESKAAASFRTPLTEPRAMRPPASEDLQEASPLKAFKKRSSTDRPSSPTLDRVRRMRAAKQEEQIKLLAKEHERPSKVIFEAKGIRDLADAAAKRQSQDNDARFAANVQELIPEIDLSISEWTTPLYGLGEAPKEEKSVKLDAVKVKHSADHSTERDEGLSPSHAITDLRLFEEISLAPKDNALDQKSAAVPRSPEIQAIAPAKAEKKKRVDLVAIPKSKAQLKSKASKHVLPDVESGRELKASASEEEFERVSTPDSGEVDQNGVKRKWYKGFLR